MADDKVGKTSKDGGGFVVKGKNGSWLDRKPTTKKKADKQAEAIFIKKSEGK